MFQIDLNDPDPAALAPAPSPAPTLAVVPAQQQSAAPANPFGRTFEKVQVARSTLKISGATAIDAFDRDVSLDDRVRAVGVFRVVKVNHIVGKDGEVIREQVLAPCAALELVPFDSTDPNDDGIVRARP